MKRIQFGLLLIAIGLLPLAVAYKASAQTTVPVNGAAPGSVTLPASGVTAGTYTCPASVTVNGIGAVTGITQGACGSGGGSVTVVSGDPACLSVSLSGTTFTVTPRWVVQTAKTGSYQMTAADECSTIPYTGTAAGAFTLPAVAGLHNGWSVCWDDVAGTQQAPVALALAVAASPTTLYGGPVTYSWDQFNCAQLDANNNWMLTTVVSADVPNPNPFK